MSRFIGARRRALLVPTALACATLALSACGSSSTDAPTAAPPAATSAVAPASGITVTDPWVKTAEAGMTAVFGTLATTGTNPVTIVSASTSASPRTELHEVVTDGGAMVMRPKDGGFVVEPGSPHVLAPGGDHIMVMDMTSPIRAGEQVEVTLSLSDGTTTSFSALAKDTTGGEENYEGGMPGMSGAPQSGDHSG